MLIIDESRGLIKSFNIGKAPENLTANHLLFADDTILFSSQEELYIENLFKTIKRFELIFGLKVNCQKSEFMGIGIEHHYYKHLAEHFDCKLVHWPTIYLELHLDGKHLTVDFWNPVVEKVEKHLLTWGSSLLSKGGRLTLIQATLNNLPIYYFSLFKAPISVTNRLEKLFRTFLWKGGLTKKGYHLVNWNIVKYPKDSMGWVLLISNIEICLFWQNGF